MHQIIHVSLNKVETRTSSRQSEPDFLNCSIKTVKHVINDAPFDFYWFVAQQYVNYIQMLICSSKYFKAQFLGQPVYLVITSPRYRTIVN